MTLKGFVCPCCQGIPALPQSHSTENSSRAPHSAEGDLLPAGSLGRSWDHSSHLRGLLTNPPSPCPQAPFSPGSASRIFLKFKSKQTSQQGLDPGRPGRCPGPRAEGHPLRAYRCKSPRPVTHPLRPSPGFRVENANFYQGLQGCVTWPLPASPPIWQVLSRPMASFCHLDKTSLFLPQDLCTCSSLNLKEFSPSFYKMGLFSSAKSGHKCHLLGEACLDHGVFCNLFYFPPSPS